MFTYGFLYSTNSITDTGYREVAAPDYPEAHAEWQRQIEAEHQTMWLDASQRIED